MAIRRVKVKVDSSKRVIKYRKPSPSFKRSMDRIAYDILSFCDEMWRGDGSMLDTSVRDVFADGIARLLHVAYDCQGCGLGLNGEAFWGFIQSSIAEWFRSRGFSEWYCQGAANLFHISRPRVLVDEVIGSPKRRKRQKKYTIRRTTKS